MEDDVKYQKINLRAVMNNLIPMFRLDVEIAIMQRANGIYIFINEFRIETDILIAISLALYGLHNCLNVSSFRYYDEIEENKYNLCLEGSIYRILPKYYDGKALTGKKSIILKRDNNE